VEPGVGRSAFDNVASVPSGRLRWQQNFAVFPDIDNGAAVPARGTTPVTGVMAGAAIESKAAEEEVRGSLKSRRPRDGSRSPYCARSGNVILMPVGVTTLRPGRCRRY